MRKQRFLSLLCLALTVALLTALCAAPASAAYADGDYTVPFSMEGLGRHNVAWSVCTVHVEGGALYVDFTIERVDPKTQAPQYDWAQTSLGTATTYINNDNFTCTVLRLPVPNLGRVAVSMQTSAMSAPTIVDYYINIDGSSIPEAAAAEPTPAPTEAPTAEPVPAPTAEPVPAPTAQPMPAPTAEPVPAPTAEPVPAPTAQPMPAPTAEPSAAPSATPTEAPKPTEAPVSTEAPKPAETPKVTEAPVSTTGAETQPVPAKAGLGLTGYLLIAVAAILVIGGGIVLATRGKKK